MRNAFLACLLAATIVLGGCATNGAASKTALPAAPLATAPNQPDPDETIILDAVQLARAGKAQEVINGPVNALIARYEAMYPTGAGVTVFCAKTTADTLLDLGGGAVHPPLDKDGKRLNVTVLNYVWAQAYWVRGFAYGELKRYDLELIELQKALRLSPRDSQYLNEIAFVHQTQGQMQKAFDAYKLAQANAAISSSTIPETSCTSYRGQGYVLVEMARLDEAEAAYHACLDLIPHEPRSLGELDYIKNLRAKRR